MEPKREIYQSYLLRLWRVTSNELVGGGEELVEEVWRASLESTLTGDRTSFANLEEMFDFIRRQAVMEDE